MAQSLGKSVNRVDRNAVIIAKNARPTSLAAADFIYGRTGSIRRTIYEHLSRKGMVGATDQEMEKELNIEGNSLRPSRLTLEKDGLIMDTQTTRPNRKGHQCVVWRIAEVEMVLL